jgi:hypothetical protein
VVTVILMGMPLLGQRREQKILSMGSLKEGAM